MTNEKLSGIAIYNVNSDPNGIFWYQRGNSFGPFNYRDPRSVKIILHPDLNRLLFPFQPVAIHMKQRYMPVAPIFMNQRKCRGLNFLSFNTETGSHPFNESGFTAAQITLKTKNVTALKLVGNCRGPLISRLLRMGRK